MLRRGSPFPGYEHWNPWMLQDLFAGGVQFMFCLLVLCWLVFFFRLVFQFNVILTLAFEHTV